jgi:hypothetical protein
MEKQTLINLVTIGISLIGFVYLINVNKEQKIELDNKENEILRLWNEKIAEYQFLVNVEYRDTERMKDFFDKLDSSYDKLRALLYQKELTETDKEQLIDFILNDYMKTAGIKEEDLYSRLDVDDIDEIFVGDNLEIVQKLEKLFNPSFMTKRVYFQDFDIWEKREGWNLNPGDTITLMIRLLKNYNFQHHQIELIPSNNLNVIRPYLGELRVVVPKDSKKGDLQKVTFKTYNWVTRDTLVQEVDINSI